MKHSPRIVFVSLVFHPDTSAASQLFTDLLTRLAQRGSRVTVLCGFPAKDVRPDARSLPRKEEYGGVQVERCGLRIEGKRNVATRALAYAGFLAHGGWWLLRMERDSIVMGATDPPFTPVVLWAFSFVGGFQYDCHMQDVYPDGLVRLGSLGPRSPLTRLWRALNGLSLRRARRVIVIGRDMAELVQREYGVTEERIAYIPAWAPAELDAGVDALGATFRREIGLDGRFVAEYSGNMGLWHDMDSLVHMAARLRDEIRIRFVFIGSGIRRAHAQGLSRDMGLRNIVWKDFLPRESLAESAAACDVALVSLRGGLEGVAVPSKIYGILAAGKPVVAQVPKRSEIALIVNEEDCGVVVDPGDGVALATAVERLEANPELRREMGLRARVAYEKKYTLGRAVERYEELWGLAPPGQGEG